MRDLSAAKRNISAIWGETLLHGAYTVLFCICIYALLFRPRPRRPNFLLPISIIMFALSSAHIWLGFVRLVSTSGWWGSTTYTTESQAEQNKWAMIDPGLCGIYIVNHIIADGLLIYRCFIIWEHNIRVIIVPSLALLGAAACGFTTICLDVAVAFAYAAGETEYNTSLIRKESIILLVMLILSLSMQLLLTALIAGRIWWIVRHVEKECGRNIGRRYQSVVAIIIESGVIYSLTLAAMIIMDMLPIWDFDIPEDCAAQIVGIVPTMIIVRMELRTYAKQAPVGIDLNILRCYDTSDSPRGDSDTTLVH